MLDALDAVRRALFAIALRSPALRFVLTNKDRRIAVQAVASVVVALVIALATPAVALIVSPLVLGIPHLASEARWLLVRTPSSDDGTSAKPLAITLAVLAAALVTACALALPRVEVALGCSAVALALAMRRTWTGRALVLVAGMACAAVVIALPGVAVATRDAVVAVHGVVSLVLWLLVFRKNKRLEVALAVGGILTASLACVLFVRGPLVAQAFLQGVHYAVWLRLVPQDGVKSAGAPTFRMTLRGWRRDLGTPGLGVTLIAMVGLGIAALTLGPAAARDEYLVLARCHVWLEMAIGAWLLSPYAKEREARDGCGMGPIVRSAHVRGACDDRERDRKTLDPHAGEQQTGLASHCRLEPADASDPVPRPLRRYQWGVELDVGEPLHRARVHAD